MYDETCQNVVLKKDGENHLDQSCENEEVFTQSQGQEYPTNNNKANWIGQILHRTYLLNHVVEGKIDGRIDVMER
jgi:hypothetical protein